MGWIACDICCGVGYGGFGRLHEIQFAPKGDKVLFKATAKHFDIVRSAIPYAHHENRRTETLNPSCHPKYATRLVRKGEKKANTKHRKAKRSEGKDEEEAYKKMAEAVELG